MTTDSSDLSAIRPVEGPTAWRAAEIQRDDAYTYELTKPEVRELDSALRYALSQDVKTSTIDREHFPLGRFGDSLKAITRQIQAGIGVCLIRGIPVERYTLSEAELLLCGIGAHFGQPMPQSSRGEMVNHVRNIEGAAGAGDRVRGYQSGSALPFHSDPSDIVGLLCISDAKAGGMSSIASAHSIHNALLGARHDALHWLYQPLAIDRHGENPVGTPPYYSTPVFMWHESRLYCRFNPGYVYSAQRYPETPRLTEERADAMDIFMRLCSSDHFRLDMKLRSGDLQLLNNNVLVHARSEYQDAPEEGTRRHLLRLWVFTSEIDDLPPGMRDRYKDMAEWHASARSRDA